MRTESEIREAIAAVKSEMETSPMRLRVASIVTGQPAIMALEWATGCECERCKDFATRLRNTSMKLAAGSN